MKRIYPFHCGYISALPLIKSHPNLQWDIITTWGHWLHVFDMLLQ